MQAIRKAILPVAGFGTRFLPATKSIPKEMLPIVDTPLVEYAVREAVSAGVTEIIFITSPAKKAIENYFGPNNKLKRLLEGLGKQDALRKVFPEEFKKVDFKFITQATQDGLGHAILQAKELIDEDEHFFILLADDLIIHNPNVCEQMLDIHQHTNSSILALNEVLPEDTKKYGVIEFIDPKNTGEIPNLKSIIEKPQSNPPSNVAITGRYLLHSHIFNYLQRLKAGVNGELQLTDAINNAMRDFNYFGFNYKGKKFDCGSKRGFVEANIYMARELNLLND